MDFEIEVTGTANLLMHNGQLANPLNPIVQEIKKITGKRKKTDDDHRKIAELEHAGSLYLDPDVGPFMPGWSLHACLVNAAKKLKKGKTVTEGLFITTDVNPLGYSGPRDPAGLFEDKNFVHLWPVKVGTARTMRCRPQFREWKFAADGWADPGLLDFADLQEIANIAGSYIGLCDWRPRYGRFSAKVKKKK